MVSYASMMLASSTSINFLNARIYNFYTDEVGMDVIWIPLVMTIYAIWNSVNDPLFGWISDKTRTRWGRRFPYVLFGFIPFILAFLAIWLIPDALTGNQKTIVTWMLLTLLIFDSLFTVVVLSWHSLFPEKFKDAKDRNIVSAMRNILSIIAVVMALVVAPLMFEYGNRKSYTAPVLMLGGLILLGFILSLYGVRDKELVEKYDKEKMKKPEEEKISFKESFIQIFKNKNLFAFVFAFCFANIAYLTLMAMVPYMVKWVFIESSNYESYIQGTAMGVAILSFAFWIFISIKKGPKLVYIICGTIFFTSLIPLAFATTGWAWITIVLMIGVGFALSGLLLIPEVLLSEVIDDDYQRFGKKREGMFFGIYGFFLRIAIVFESYLITIILNTTGYDANAAAQTELAKKGIKLIMVGVPVVCFTLGILLLFFFYDISRKRIGIKTEKKFSIF